MTINFAISGSPCPCMTEDLKLSCRENWHPSYALCNMYQDGQEGVGAHAGMCPLRLY